MKRHARPWACTFLNCKKTKLFGSKADWKRHEFQQHGDVEVWECRTSIDDKACISSNSCPSFWCGFCVDKINIDLDGCNDPWKERFDHIDEHFSGKNGRTQQGISEWKYATEMEDSGASTTFLTSPASSLSEAGGGRSESESSTSPINLSPMGSLGPPFQEISSVGLSASKRKACGTSGEQQAPRKRLRRMRIVKCVR